MFANKPQMAKEWASHTPKNADLPEYVSKTQDEPRKKNFDHLVSFFKSKAKNK